MMRKICEKLSSFYERHGRKRVISSDEYMWRHYILFLGREYDPDGNVKEHNFNAFLHNIRGSDEPTYHDHPWPYMTIILCGGYWEHVPIIDSEGYVIGDKKIWRGPGTVRFAKSSQYHWLEMGEKSTWTLFLRFKRCQEWGFLQFMTNEKIHWKEWTAKRQAMGFTR